MPVVTKRGLVGRIERASTDRSVVQLATDPGFVIGVRLAGARDVPLIAQLGLQPDDVVTSVNGIALDSPERAQEIARNLAGASALNVTVRRNSKSENLSAALR